MSTTIVFDNNKVIIVKENYDIVRSKLNLKFIELTTINRGSVTINKNNINFFHYTGDDL